MIKIKIFSRLASVTRIRHLLEQALRPIRAAFISPEPIRLFHPQHHQKNRSAAFFSVPLPVAVFRLPGPDGVATPCLNDLIFKRNRVVHKIGLLPRVRDGPPLSRSPFRGLPPPLRWPVLIPQGEKQSGILYYKSNFFNNVKNKYNKLCQHIFQPRSVRSPDAMALQ